MSPRFGDQDGNVQLNNWALSKGGSAALAFCSQGDALCFKAFRLRISIREVIKNSHFSTEYLSFGEKISQNGIMTELILREILMHRQSGRHLKVEYYLEIECLPDDQLFSPSEIVKRKYDKQAQPECFTRMFHAIYQFGLRNGLTLYPDNGKRLPGGKYAKTEKGRVRLKPGERRAKWLGKTWKSKLYVEDRQAIERYAKQRLVETLNLCSTQKQREEDAMKRTVRSIRMKKGLWVAALVAAVVLTAGSLYNYSFLNQGYAILRSQGPKAALEFFQNRGENYGTLFGKAWAAYRTGEYETAEQLAKRVLKSGALKDQARASYLLGDLNTIEGEFGKAEEYLLSAYAIYLSTGNDLSLYRTELFLAKVYLAKKDLDNAAYYLNLAETTPFAQTDHYFFYLNSQLAYLRNEFQEALLLSLHREKVFNGDRSRLTGIYSDIGFYSALSGDFAKCLDYTMKAQSIASEIEDTNALMYNNVNMCLYLKCSMQDFTDLRQAILEYARANHEQKLMEWMYFVDKFTCPIEPVDNGHGDPPDDPPPDSPLNLTAPGHLDPLKDPRDPPPN